jgi:hypothetical protein
LRSPRQAIAIGLNEARRAGIPLAPPKPGRAKPKTRQSTELALKRGPSKRARKPPARAAASHRAALKREPKNTASRQAKPAAQRRERAA